MNDQEREAGRAMRRRVLGDAHVDAAIKPKDAMSAAKTELSEYVWGRIWTRPGLSLQMRSVANVALLTALNRPHELRVHIRGALNNGLTPDEILEVMLQCATYCGIPAARDSFAVMRDVLEEHGVPARAFHE